MKKILVALAIVALMLASIASLSIPHVKADTSEAKLLSYSWHVAPSNLLAENIGDLVAVGEVENVGSNPLSSVFVSGEAYDSNGSLLDSAQANAFLTNLSPGKTAPFYLDFTPELSVTQDLSWVSLATNVTVSVTSASDATQAQYSGLTIPVAGISASDSTGIYTVAGTVQNIGTQVTGDVVVVTTFYNGSGTVVSLNFTDVSTSMLPGNSAMFVASPLDNTPQLSSSITNYTLLIQSAAAAASTPTPVATASTQPSSSSSSSNTPTQSQPIALSSGLIIDAAIAAVIIVLVVLAVLVLFRRHKRNAEFDLPPPPPPT